jgi:hypothetical protein
LNTMYNLHYYIEIELFRIYFFFRIFVIFKKKKRREALILFLFSYIV